MLQGLHSTKYFYYPQETVNKYLKQNVTKNNTNNDTTTSTTTTTTTSNNCNNNYTFTVTLQQ